MGRVRTKTVKKAAKLIVERYYPKLTLDFQVNKKITGEVALIATKRLRNKIAGYVTHLMIRISKGPVRGISLKLQEEERERRDNTVPKQSMMVKLVEDATIDEETQEMLRSIDFGTLADTITVAEKPQTYNNRTDRKFIPGSVKAK